MGGTQRAAVLGFIFYASPPFAISLHSTFYFWGTTCYCFTSILFSTNFPSGIAVAETQSAAVAARGIDER